jgi:glycine hydroxymethyltransferase
MNAPNTPPAPDAAALRARSEALAAGHPLHPHLSQAAAEVGETP